VKIEIFTACTTASMLCGIRKREKRGCPPIFKVHIEGNFSQIVANLEVQPKLPRLKEGGRC
jgi:hypothetical protein